jgi:hypothetical protein
MIISRLRIRGMMSGIRRLMKPPMTLPRISLSRGTLLESMSFSVPFSFSPTMAS